MNEYTITISNPSDEYPLIDYGRDFNVWGRLQGKIEEDMILCVRLLDEKGKCFRKVSSCKKNDRNVFTGFKDLTSYKEELDPGKERLKSFGFPELQVKDLRDPFVSLRDASIKCFYDDACFKALIVSGSDVSHGRIFDTGMAYTDENGRPYETLEKGDYVIEVSLYDREETLCAKACKKIRIDVRNEVVIVRFNPLSHKKRMIDWCKENGFTIINDTLPGYLEAYLGTWYYHMGLLPYYRSNDIAVYQDALVHMFVYLCDPTSTSYETELAYLQHKGQVKDKERFIAYRYDIGEAKLGKGKPYERTAKIEEFDEDLHIYRVDIVNDMARENVFDLSEKNIKEVFYDTRHIKVKAGNSFAVCGAVRPLQLKKEDVLLKKDNTYSIRNEVKYIRYSFSDGERIWEEKRRLLMERIDGTSIGTSVYEFYNLFHFDEKEKGKMIEISMEIYNDEGKMSDCMKKLEAEVL